MTQRRPSYFEVDAFLIAGQADRARSHAANDPALLAHIHAVEQPASPPVGLLARIPPARESLWQRLLDLLRTRW